MRRYFGKNPVDFKDERKTSLGKFAHIFKKEQRNVQSFGSVKRSANRKSHVFFETFAGFVYVSDQMTKRYNK